MICYRITNLVTGKIYVGVTTSSIEQRFKEHCWAATRGEQNVLYKSMRKHGVENFIVEEFASAIGTAENLYALEQELIAQENTELPHGYNMTSGGENPPSQAGKVSHQKGKKLSVERKQKLNTAGLKLGRAWNKGLTLPAMNATVKASISKTLKGRAKPEGFADKIKQSWIKRRAANEVARKILSNLTNKETHHGVPS